MTDGYVHVYEDEDEERAAKFAKDVQIMRKALGPSEAFGLSAEQTPDLEERERYVHQMIRYRTFGTLDQVRATAERVCRMLSVELHQDVVIEQLHQGSGDSVPEPVVF